MRRGSGRRPGTAVRPLGTPRRALFRPELAAHVDDCPWLSEPYFRDGRSLVTTLRHVSACGLAHLRAMVPADGTVAPVRLLAPEGHRTCSPEGAGGTDGGVTLIPDS